MKAKKIKQRSATKADKELGDKIRARRIEISMSQAELGEHIGVSFQQVQKYEKGVNRVSVPRLAQIAKALDNTEMSYFTGENSGEQTKMLSLFTDRPSQRLLVAFHKIADMETRYRVVGLLESMTAHGG
jgi:transcriptional regulator with XRE-family HTH domain